MNHPHWVCCDQPARRSRLSELDVIPQAMRGRCEARVLASRWKRASRSASWANASGSVLNGDVAIQFRIAGAKYLPHSPFPDAGDHFVDAEANAGGEGQVWRHYRGERGRERDRSR